MDHAGDAVGGLARFDDLVAEVMAEWRIPGLAMAVVDRGEAPLLRCWGVCDIDSGAPVTPDTVFPICRAGRATPDIEPVKSPAEPMVR
jgi:CubicO group peptidase (beta-lactamase class C family)